MTIRSLRKNEIHKIQNFLKINWRSSILDKNSDFFKWLFYRDHDKKEINFVVDIEDKTGEIFACLGFIETNQFTHQSDNKLNTVWLTNWHSISNNNLIAIKLIKFIEANNKYKMIGTVGCKPITKKMLKAIGYETGVMKRFVAINPYIQEFKILSKKFLPEISNLNHNYDLNHSKNIKVEKLIKKSDLLKIKSFEEDKKILPFKNPRYLLSRYIDHPIYEYEIYKINHQLKDCIVVLRKCFKGNSFCYRIVDVYGSLDNFFKVSKNLLLYLFKKGPEFVDIYFYKKSILNSFDTGFIEITNKENEIIPYFYEPFLFANHTLNVAYKCNNFNNDNVTIFKADGDQDNPSGIQDFYS